MQSESSVAELAAVLTRIQGMLLSQENATTAVHQLALVAKDLVPGAAGAGISLIDDHGKKTSTGATDMVVEAADAAQFELGEGPCLSAWATSTPQRIDDTATDDRWPEWSSTAARSGIRSVLSTPLVFGGQSLGALKVYTRTDHIFSAREERLLVLLAGASAVLLGCAQTTDAPQRLSASLRAGVAERQAIDRATGMLMEQRGTDPEDAQCVLLTASRNQHRSMAEVARQILDRHPDPEQ